MTFDDNPLNDDGETIIINSSCSIKRYNNQLIIKIDESKELISNILFFIIFFSMFMIFILPFFYILTHNPFESFFTGSMLVLIIPWMILLGLVCFKFFLKCINYRRVIEWDFDKSNQTIIKSKISPKFKKIKTFSLQEINSIIYLIDNIVPAAPVSYETDSVYIMTKNRKLIKIYKASADKGCVSLGRILSEFLNKKLNYKAKFLKEVLIGNLFPLTIFILFISNISIQMEIQSLIFLSIFLFLILIIWITMNISIINDYRNKNNVKRI